MLVPLAGGFLAAEIASAVVNGASGVDHSKAMMALSRLYDTPIAIHNPEDPATVDG
jgi:hypothetical protein